VCIPHCVSAPLQAQDFLDTALQKRCEELLRETADNHGFWVFELQVAPDHVHLFLGLKPTQSVSGAIRLLKCNSARMLFAEHPRAEGKILVGTLLVRRQVLQVHRQRDGGDDTALHRQIEARLVNGYPTREGRVLHFVCVFRVFVRRESMYVSRRKGEGLGLRVKF